MNSLWIAAQLVARTVNSRKGFIFGLLLPAVIISAFVGFLGMRGDGLPDVDIVDLDRSGSSAHLLHALAQTGDYRLHETEDREDATTRVTGNDTIGAIIIPAGFEAALLEGARPSLQLIRLQVSEQSIMLELDVADIAGAMAQAHRLADSFHDGAIPAMADTVLQQHLDQQIKGSVVETGSQPDPQLHMVIGLTLMFLMILINQSVTTIVEDRHNQMLSRLYAAPVRSFQIGFGHFLGSFSLGTIQVLLITLLTRTLFSYDFGVSAWTQFLILEAFVLAAFGIASTVGGLVRNKNQLSMINTLVMTPTCMIGGCFWPVSLMPDFMQKLANFVPQKWAIEAMTLASTGEPLSVISVHLGILILFAVVLLGFGVSILRPAQ